MIKQNNSRAMFNMVLKFAIALIVGMFIASFSGGISTVHAAESGYETIEENQTPLEESADDNSGGAVIILMGGMLIIILAVVISVVGTFVSTAAIVDEL